MTDINQEAIVAISFLASNYKLIIAVFSAVITAAVTWTIYRIKLNSVYKRVTAIEEWKKNYTDTVDKKFEKQATVISEGNTKLNEVASELKHSREYTGKTLEKIEVLLVDILRGNNNGS